MHELPKKQADLHYFGERCAEMEHALAQAPTPNPTPNPIPSPNPNPDHDLDHTHALAQDPTLP